MKSKLQEKMIEDLQLRGYAERTQTSYARAVRQLENYWHRSAEEIEEQQVRDYFLYCRNEANWSAATMRIAYSGIKFFYTVTLPMDWETIRLLKIKRLSTPPTVLSIDEVRLILNRARQPQIKAFLATVYSCGLRLSEALNLEVTDIDRERMTLRVRDGKGAKERYVPLPEPTYLLLRAYWITHRNERLIFPALGRRRNQGPTALKPMALGSVQGAAQDPQATAEDQEACDDPYLTPLLCHAFDRGGHQPTHCPTVSRARLAREHHDLSARLRSGPRRCRRAHQPPDGRAGS
jgi:integrase/recombinase XerD